MIMAVKLVKLKELSFSGSCNSDWKENAFCEENSKGFFWKK